MEQQHLQNLKYGTIYVYSQSMDSLRHATDLLQKNVNPMDIEWVEDPGRDDVLFVARRFNLGNIGRYATVSLRTSQYNWGAGLMKALHRFTDVLMKVGDPKSGDVVIDENDFMPTGSGKLFDIEPDCQFSSPCAAPQDKTRVKKNKPKFQFSLKKKLKSLIEDTDECIVTSPDMQPSTEEMAYDESYCIREEDQDYLLQAEDQEIKTIELERKLALERIRHDIVNYIARYHDDPKELIAELLRGKVIVGQPGRVLVNGDMKIVLPEYDEMEIQMPAMCRTLYILFLKHHKQGSDGIVLKNIDLYQDEILDIYGLVKPGANDRIVKKSVDNLCNPLSDSLNQMISRINRCIKNVITDKELSRDYCITGKRGQSYNILLDPQYIELPRAVTGD